MSPRIQIDFPVRKIYFGTGRKRYHFLCHFHWENVYQRKIERVYIQAKIEYVYQGNFITMKITKKNRFYESRLSYKGGNDETLTRPENLNLNSRGAGGGDINNVFLWKKSLFTGAYCILSKKKSFTYYMTLVSLWLGLFLGGYSPPSQMFWARRRLENWRMFWGRSKKVEKIYRQKVAKLCGKISDAPQWKFSPYSSPQFFGSPPPSRKKNPDSRFEIPPHENLPPRPQQRITLDYFPQPFLLQTFIIMNEEKCVKYQIFLIFSRNIRNICFVPHFSWFMRIFCEENSGEKHVLFLLSMLEINKWGGERLWYL